MWDILKTNISFYTVTFFIAINIVTDKCDAQATTTSMYDVILVTTTTTTPPINNNSSNNTLKKYNNNITNNITNSSNSTYNSNTSTNETTLSSTTPAPYPINGWSEVCLTTKDRLELLPCFLHLFCMQYLICQAIHVSMIS